MVLVGNGRAKQGHDTIAEHLIHGAFKPVHGIHHALYKAGSRSLGGFRVEVTNRRSSFEVGKQHRHLFALAFQGTARGQDFLGEIGRRVGKGRRDLEDWLAARPPRASCHRRQTRRGRALPRRAPADGQRGVRP